MHRLKTLPDKLSEIPAFAFKCRLADIDYSVEPKLDSLAQRDFLKVVRDGLVKCTVKGLDPVTKTWEVYLKTDSTLEDINHRIRFHYYRRKRTAPIRLESKKKNSENDGGTEVMDMKTVSPVSKTKTLYKIE